MSEDFVSSTKADLTRKYVLGRDGWVFLDHDSNRVLDQCRGLYRLDAAGVQKWVALLEAREAYCQQIGARHVMLVAPNKETVYAENLPAIMPLSEARAVRQVEAALKSAAAAPPLYPLAALREGRQQGLVYPMTDTHWSGFGAAIAYRQLIKSLRAKGVRVKAVHPARVTFDTVEIVGDLGVKLSPPKASQTLAARIEQPSGRLVFDNHIPNRGRMRVFVNEDNSRPSCVMFGDSFGGNLLPFLKESFSTLVYVYGKVFDRELIEAYRPDVVITQIVERFMIEPPSDDPHFTYLSVLRDKLGLLSTDDLADLDRQCGEVTPAVFAFGAAIKAIIADRDGQPLPERIVEEIKTRHGHNSEIAHLLATHYLRCGDPLSAVKFAEAAVRGQPNRPQFHHQHALVNLRLGNSAVAEPSLRSAIELDPNVPWWHYQLAQALFRQQNFAAARDQARDYLRWRPASADAWQLIGRCEEALGNWDGAIAALWQASRAKPDWRWPLVKISGLCLKQKSHVAEGLRAAEQLVQLPGTARQSAESWLLRAHLLVELSRLDEALDCAERSCAADPDWVWARSSKDAMKSKVPMQAAE